MAPFFELKKRPSFTWTTLRSFNAPIRQKLLTLTVARNAYDLLYTPFPAQRARSHIRKPPLARRNSARFAHCSEPARPFGIAPILVHKRGLALQLSLSH